MVTNVNVKVYGSGHNASLMRQRVASRPILSSSVKEMRKPVMHVAILVLLVVLGVSQIFAWQVGKTVEAVTQLKAEGALLADENVRLRARKAQLSSKKHIEAVASARLELFAPGKKQVYRM